MIERQKRLFHSQDLQKLLFDCGVDMKNPDPPSVLALETFDDTEFESRPPLEWMSLAMDTDGNMRWLPAKFLFQGSEDGGKAVWVDCRVTAYNSVTERFSVSYEHPASGADGEADVSRINLCFAAEDPFVFAKRVGTCVPSTCQVIAQAIAK